MLFGDVYLCGGQSNMQFAMGAIENSTTEIAKADGFPTVRLFTVGQDTESAHALQQTCFASTEMQLPPSRN